MATLRLGAIADALGGELALGGNPPAGGAEHEVEGYSIDSRSVKRGDLFFALVGPRHDGHRFVGAALAGGATAAIVGRDSGPFPDAPALIRVPDTTRALQDLGAHVRRTRPLKVVGITGSAGKTTAKEMTAAVMGERYRAYRNEGNLNNTYGLPLSLLRMPDDREAVVLEMGMSYHGELTRLVEIGDPDVGVILNVLPVHIEHFGRLEKIAEAKGELFRTMREDAVAVYNADDPSTAKLGRAFSGRSIPYGVTSSSARIGADAFTMEGLEGSRFTLRVGKETVPARIGIPGRHNLYNALAAAATGHALGIGAEAIARAIGSVRPAAMRGVLHRLQDGIRLLDDSYNSNPAAMERVIEILVESQPRGRRVLVSGDMLELGSHGRKAHTRLGEQVAEAGIDLFIAVGPLSGRAAAAARGGRAIEVHHFADSAAAADFVPSALRSADLIIVKGSRGIAMEHVVRAVIASFPPDDAAGGQR
ncbi:MAG: UDP-N-acetylmuramoyl-tripeptide--D-alanyl-D-alanine ligase [Acidobacteriota bacterium]